MEPISLVPASNLGELICPFRRTGHTIEPVRPEIVDFLKLCLLSEGARP